MLKVEKDLSILPMSEIFVSLIQYKQWEKTEKKQELVDGLVIDRYYSENLQKKNLVENKGTFRSWSENSEFESCFTEAWEKTTGRRFQMARGFWEMSTQEYF